MSNRSRVIAAVAACVMSLGAAPAFAGSINYDFNAVAGESTPVTLQGATFSSPSDPGAYTFGPNGGLFSLLGPEVLSSGGTTATLDIAFNSSWSGVTLNFALGDFLGAGGNDTLTITANDGTSTVATASLDLADSFFPEGSVNFQDPHEFTSLAITSAYPIVISNMETVPEPASMLLVASSLLALTMLRRRAR